MQRWELDAEPTELGFFCWPMRLQVNEMLMFNFVWTFTLRQPSRATSQRSMTTTGSSATSLHVWCVGSWDIAKSGRACSLPSWSQSCESWERRSPKHLQASCPGILPPAFWGAGNLGVGATRLPADLLLSSLAVTTCHCNHLYNFFLKGNHPFLGSMLIFRGVHNFLGGRKMFRHIFCKLSSLLAGYFAGNYRGSRHHQSTNKGKFTENKGSKWVNHRKLAGGWK